MQIFFKLAIGFAMCCLMPLSMAAHAQAIPEREASTGVLPVANGKASLTISGGNGYWHREIYQDGEQPHITVYAGTGQMLPDGNYSYEYRSANLDDIESEEPSFDLSQWHKQNVEVVRGHFLISGGAITFR